MDISGPVRAALRQTLNATGGGETPGTISTLFVRMAAFGEGSPMMLPAFLDAGYGERLPTVGGMDGGLALASLIRVLPRVDRSIRHEWSEALRQRAGMLEGDAQKLLVSRTTKPAEFLWQHWLMVLARERLKMEMPGLLLTGMWRRGIGGQSKAGHLNPLDGPPTEEWVREEMRALHAAYNAAAPLRRPDLFAPIERMVDWHVKNTAPGVGADRPWGLAAFASAPGSEEFARQRLEAAARSLSGDCAVLLADALLTQEEAAEADVIMFEE